MSAPVKKAKPELYDCGRTDTLLVDCVIRMQTANGITHIVLGQTIPASDRIDRDECHVALRLAIPEQSALLLARTIIAGTCTDDWIMSRGSEDVPGVRHDH